MNNSQIMTVLKHLEIAKSQLLDCDSILYKMEADAIQKIQDTIMHLEFYCDTTRF